METIIITVDLGHFRAYKVKKDSLEGTRIQQIESYDSIESHVKLGDRLSDTAGRFGLAGGKNGAAKGYGEPHNLELETNRRLIKMIAKSINDLILSEKYTKWYLAAGNEINSQIVENLDPNVSAKLKKNIKSNLTKISKSEVMDYFK